MPLLFAVGLSTVLMCLGQADWVEDVQGLVWLNTGGLGMVSCLGMSEARRRKVEREVQRLLDIATTDPLTGVANRRSFDQEVERRIDELKRHGTRSTLLVIDVDHFKAINDVYGHDAGDCVLQAVVGSIQAMLRKTDTLFRIGGEEFAVVMTSTDAHDAGFGAERIRAAVSSLRMPGELSELEATASLGGAELRGDEDGPCWFHRADAALLRAKRGGRNQVAFDGVEAASVSEHAMGSEIAARS